MRHKQNCKLAWQATQVVGKLHRCSALTKKDLIQCLRTIGNALKRFGLNNIRHIKPRHIERYFAELRVRNMSSGRIANHATAMRLICRAIGKPDIVPANSKLGCARNLSQRTRHADKRIDAEKVTAVKNQLGRNHQIAYEMARHFGLRVKETLLSHNVLTRGNSHYLVVEGAKGGRPRQIPIKTAEQRNILASNKEYRDSHNGKLIDFALTLKQGMRRLENDMKSAGASRDSNTNFHALRREWIIEQCLAIKAQPAEQHSRLLDELVEAIGHGRLEVIRAYTGIMSEK